MGGGGTRTSPALPVESRLAGVSVPGTDLLRVAHQWDDDADPVDFAGGTVVRWGDADGEDAHTEDVPVRALELVAAHAGDVWLLTTVQGLTAYPKWPLVSLWYRAH